MEAKYLVKEQGTGLNGYEDGWGEGYGVTQIKYDHQGAESPQLSRVQYSKSRDYQYNMNKLYCHIGLCSVLEYDEKFALAATAMVYT